MKNATLAEAASLKSHHFKRGPHGMERRHQRKSDGCDGEKIILLWLQVHAGLSRQAKVNGLAYFNLCSREIIYLAAAKHRSKPVSTFRRMVFSGKRRVVHPDL
jgi:hypothetical protein